MIMWRRSPRGDGAGGHRVERARLADRAGVRDGRAERAGVASLSAAGFGDLLARARSAALTG